MTRSSVPALPSLSMMLIGVLSVVPTGGCHSRTPVTLTPSSDTVNVGYGVQTRAQTGEAVRSITGEELANVRVKRVEQLLAGRVAGVHVYTTPNGGFAIRIRGASTFIGNKEPLYVIDGLPVEVEPGQGLNFLDPADIRRIDVLKDPAETSMYGVRGANGVIIITTKRGATK